MIRTRKFSALVSLSACALFSACLEQYDPTAYRQQFEKERLAAVAPQPKLTEEATAIIRRLRPDILMSVDPGEWYDRWHKSDHRMAAFNTIDAVRAAEFWLYFPNQKLQQALQPYKVPEMYFFYPSPQEANYFVNIDGVADLKLEAAAKQVSQFEPAVTKYRPDWNTKDLEVAKADMRKEQPRKDGHYVEAFRYSTGFNQY